MMDNMFNPGKPAQMPGGFGNTGIVPQGQMDPMGQRPQWQPQMQGFGAMGYGGQGFGGMGQGFMHGGGFGQNFGGFGQGQGFGFGQMGQQWPGNFGCR